MNAETLERFFGEGNEIDLGALQLTFPGQAEWLKGWSDDAGYRSDAVVLPRLRPDDDALLWYGVARDSVSFAELRRIVRAFVGPSYSDGVLLLQEPTDDFESWLVEEFGGYTIRFVPWPAGRNTNAEIRRRLGWFRRLTQERPAYGLSVRDSAGRLLTEFDWDVRAGRFPAAYETLRRIESTGQLDALNLRFLRIRWLSAQNDWDGVLNLRDLADVLLARRPAAVTEAIAEAVVRYHRLDEPTTHIQQCLDRFRSTLGVSTLLVRGIGRSAGPNLRLLAVLDSVSSDAPVPAWLGDQRRDSIGEVIADLIALSHPASAPPRLDWELLSSDPVTAYELLSGLESVEGEWVQRALQQAIEAESPEYCAIVLDALDRLSPDDRDQFEGSLALRGWVAVARGLAGRPQDWPSWVGALLADGDHELVAIVRDSAAGWDPEWWVSMAGQVSERLAGLDDLRLRIVVQVLPQIHESLERIADRTGDAVRDLLLVLIEIAALSDVRGTIELQGIEALSALLLDLGPDRPSYQRLLQALDAVVRDVASPQRVGWILEVAVLVAGYPQRDTDASARFEGAILAGLSPHIAALAPGQVVLLKSILGENLRDMFPDRQEDAGGRPPPANLTQLRVALYSLQRGVTDRVRRFLEARFEGVRVAQSGSTVCDERLKSMARNSDLVVVATQAASHAATDCIRAAASDERIIYASGSGSSSMIEAILDKLDSGSATV